MSGSQSALKQLTFKITTIDDKLKQMQISSLLLIIKNYLVKPDYEING